MFDDAAADRFGLDAGGATAARLRALLQTRFWSACALLGVLALLLRLPTLADRSLWLDETYSAWFARLPLRELWTRAPLYETHPPLYYTLLKLWSALAGRSEAGLLLTTNAASIAFAQQARPYALQALAGALAVFCAAMLVRVRVLAVPAQAPAPARMPAYTRAWPWVLGLALSAGLTMWLHDTGAFAALGIWTGMTLGLCLATPGPHRPQALAVGAAGIGALLVWSPFVPMVIEQSAAMARMAYWLRFSPHEAKAA